MKIGITMGLVTLAYSGGVNVQCRMWHDGLQSLGHDVYLLNEWDKFDFRSFDYIIIVGFGRSFIDYVRILSNYENIKLICAPIIDPNETSLMKFKIKSHFYGSVRRGLSQPLHDLYVCRNNFAFFLARSEFEKHYIVEGLGVSESKVKIAPLPMRFTETPTFDLGEKEDVCLHVSRLACATKNVSRLIKAAKKYSFHLKLAGTLKGSDERNWLDKQIQGCSNIEYIGWLDEKDLINEYRKAKVFALPSTNEGVGMVALEAAAYGCEICLTGIGGPKEYYNGRAVLVNPYDVDDIGKGIIEAMNNKRAQPELSNYLLKHYSMEGCMKQLERFLIDELTENTIENK